MRPVLVCTRDPGKMEGLTAYEAEQYDRQIRLWGLEAQKRLRRSSLLVVGARGLGAELCKNIVLAGVQSVTLLDHAPLTPADLGSRFLGRADGENRAQQAVEQLQALNPNVRVQADTDCVEDKEDAFFTQFSAVCVTCCARASLLHINAVCRAHGVKFFCGDVWGFYGYFFSDLGQHEFAVELARQEEEVIAVDGPVGRRRSSGKQQQQQQQLEEKTTVMQTCSFPPLSDALAVDWASKPARYFRRTPPTWLIVQTLQVFRDGRGGRDPDGEGDREGLLSARDEVAAQLRVNSDLIPEHFHRYCLSELSPVCAIVGGVLGQEVIKALSGKDKPYHNCFLYDGVTSTGIVESLRP